MSQISDEERWRVAERLAAQSYKIDVSLETATDGKPIWSSNNPALKGCSSQGETMEEAIRNLADARIDYIYFLLLDGLPVPEPASLDDETTVKIVVMGSEPHQDAVGTDFDHAPSLPTYPVQISSTID
jgi:predicted RNase H-like HicB family nuclease